VNGQVVSIATAASMFLVLAVSSGSALAYALHWFAGCLPAEDTVKSNQSMKGHSSHKKDWQIFCGF
jgi:hypothetical protein